MSADKVPKHNRIKPKKNKMTAELQRFHDWVRDKGCVITGAPCSIHHEPFGGGKKDHKLVVGLSPEIHQHGPTARHKMSLEAFNEHYGVDLEQMARDNWDEWATGGSS